MEMAVIVCELVVAVCTLVYLFSLQHSVDNGAGRLSQYKSRDIALGFLSLAFTLGVLVVTAIGPEMLARSALAAWSHATAASVSVIRPMGQRSDFSTSVGVVPVSYDEADNNHDAVDEGVA